MKRSALIFCLSLLAATQAVWAQPRHGGPGGHAGQGGQSAQGAQAGQGSGRHLEDRRAERQQQRREQIERNQQQGGQQGGQQGNAQGGQQGQRMTPDERRALREQIRNHGRDIYRDPSKG